MQSHLTQRKGNTGSSEEKENLFIFKRSKGKHLLSSGTYSELKYETIWQNEWGGKMDTTLLVITQAELS